jgi:chromate transport protein ChrA
MNPLLPGIVCTQLFSIPVGRNRHQTRGSPCALTKMVAPGGIVVCTR